MWSSWPCVSTSALVLAARSKRYENPDDEVDASSSAPEHRAGVDRDEVSA